MKTPFFTLLIILFCSSSCSHTKTNQEHKPLHSVKVKYQNILLENPPDWLGGTENTPAYFDILGRKILTPLQGFDTIPVTYRSVNENGKIIFPHDGFQLIGDMKLDDYISLAKEALTLRKNFPGGLKPLIIEGDSNFPEKGAKILTPEKKILAEFVYRNLIWSRIK